MSELSPLDAGAARALLADVLTGLAPEVDLDLLDPEADLQIQADLDSMDFLNLVEGIATRMRIDIPEVDYDQLASVNSAVDYLSRRAQPV